MKTISISWHVLVVVLVLSLMASSSMAGRRRMLTIEGNTREVGTTPTDQSAPNGKSLESSTEADGDEPDLDNHHSLPRKSFGGPNSKSPSTASLP